MSAKAVGYIRVSTAGQANDGVTLMPVEFEQTVIRHIGSMRNRGWSYRAIAEELTRREVPTKKGNARWTHQAVASILRRTTT